MSLEEKLVKALARVETLQAEAVGCEAALQASHDFYMILLDQFVQVCSENSELREDAKRLQDDADYAEQYYLDMVEAQTARQQLNAKVSDAIDALRDLELSLDRQRMRNSAGYVSRVCYTLQRYLYDDDNYKPWVPEVQEIVVHMTAKEKDDLLNDIDNQGFYIIDWEVMNFSCGSLEVSRDYDWKITFLVNEPWIEPFLSELYC